MVIEEVLLYNGPRSGIREDDVAEIESKLDEFGIRHHRLGDEDNFNFDAVIALGGDGTMLRASWLAYEKSKPILSVNFGTLGYMSGLEKSELDLLSKLKGDFEIEKRMLISITAIRNGKVIASTTALNEAVVSRPNGGEIAQIQLKCDGAKVFDYRADGIIIATPTGSSAYAMSAGGPIIDTKLDAICVCPICPHILGVRAMVFSPNSVLEAVDLNRAGGNLLLADGGTICQLEQGDIVRVEKSPKSLELIKIKKDAFYETLYKKMS
ncbi:MAG: NAD(+)/NADH kinase [Ruminococcaceae bacterium]|nr:NAD(+)/NADH kinase [Oscillospiraceae bacterium]